ncbi:hypothetical protein DRF65_22925 [Chryseobacterium pennae]|uniref:Uncharacterized protein n=1 Tax=Chryseobacterium pennae TaxID=2258962 RepID=A0A3D9C3A0_9FLAO|nr:hypothetical protein DRF65_22925 [Chryseobacterium pennae]
MYNKLIDIVIGFYGCKDKKNRIFLSDNTVLRINGLNCRVLVGLYTALHFSKFSIKTLRTER